jgi:tungstate transport system ATP-binding protein
VATDLLTIRNLIIRRGGRLVLEVDDLSVHQNEVLAIVGPNGAGKSTLLLVLARLLHFERGEFLFNGKSAQAESDLAYRRRLALVLQDPLLFDASVFDNVASGLKFRGLPKNEIRPRVEIWLERLGISHLKPRRANELSGGEAQRVSLARALVLEPALLLLDEPFGALDPPTRNSLLDDLGQILPAARTTTILITHDLKEATRLASRVAVMLEGQIVQVGAPQEVFASPANNAVAAFLGI